MQKDVRVPLGHSVSSIEDFTNRGPSHAQIAMSYLARETITTTLQFSPCAWLFRPEPDPQGHVQKCCSSGHVCGCCVRNHKGRHSTVHRTEPAKYDWQRKQSAAENKSKSMASHFSTALLVDDSTAQCSAVQYSTEYSTICRWVTA